MFNSIHEECGVFGIFENKTTHVCKSKILTDQITRSFPCTGKSH